MKAVLLLLSVLAGLGASLPLGAQAANSKANLQLRRLRSVSLAKHTGTVDQILELPDGNIVIRDSGSSSQPSQVIEVYDRNGAYLRRIGSYGLEPGHYRALRGIAFSKTQQNLWVADGMGRISRFGLDGRFIDSMTLHKPGFHPYDIAIDDKNGHVFVSGCVALHFYLDFGCTMLHEYDLATRTYVKSFLQNDEQAVAKKYFAVEDYQIALSGGNLYAIDSPMRKFWVVAGEEKVESHEIPSRIITEIPQLDPTLPWAEIAKGQWLFDKIVPIDGAVVISANRKGNDDFRLEVLTPQGKPLGTDLPSPGRLIGGSDHGNLWFGHRSGNSFIVEEYSSN